MQAKFNGREDFLEWRAHWRKQYKAVSAAIRYYKEFVKAGKGSNLSIANARSLLRREQMVARNLMIALEGVIAADLVRLSESKNKHYSDWRTRDAVEQGRPTTGGRRINVAIGNRTND